MTPQHGRTDEGAPSPLEERLVSLIRSNGPISIADFMSDALGHPHYGYYMARSPFGADGDFTTAPEISQIFGELIGAFLVRAFHDLGAPASFQLIELGPGRGVLMADILRAAGAQKDFISAARLTLVEMSGRLRHEQSRRLAQSAVAPAWADRFTDSPDGPALIIANEFFDCLPIRQFERCDAGWRERLVGLDQAGQRLAITHASTPPAPEMMLPPAESAPLGAVFEVNEPACRLAADIAIHLRHNRGRALIIDYGHLTRGFGDTLQAVRAHRFSPPLAAPGLADLTAHVDFDAIAHAALDEGASVAGPVTQGAFLRRLGLDLRLANLCAAHPERADELTIGARRIADAEHMGEIFKVLCVSSPDLPPPPGFDP